MVWGTADAVVKPALSKKLGKQLSRGPAPGKVLALTGAGHSCYVEQPAEFSAGLLELLDGIKASSP